MFDWLFPTDEQWEALSVEQKQRRFFAAGALAIGIGAGIALPLCYHANNAMARATCHSSMAWSSAVRAEVKSACSSGIE